MLTLWGGRQRFCDGISRRSFLQIGALGTGLTLADLLRLRGRAAEDTTRRARSVIMIYLAGGPSHIDTYDMKPDAAAEYRGEFKPIDTSVPGVRICEHLPLQARLLDKMTLLRSVAAAKEEHSNSEVMTGYIEEDNLRNHHPSFGSVISKLRGNERPDITPYVLMHDRWSIGTDPGFLGAAHQPYTIASYGQGRELINTLSPRKDVNAQRGRDRRDLLNGFDSLRRDIDASGAMAGLDAMQARALDMVTSGAVGRALDLSKVDAATRERYKLVPNFLLARRLVEVGVGCVTVWFGPWDTHDSNFKSLKDYLLPRADAGLAHLVQDLHDRGLDKDVLTIMWGEFGRTPRINNRNGGRDHWPAVMSAVVSGGGLKMGQVVGSSSARGEFPKERPYRVSQVLSTMYESLGIDPAQAFIDNAGRPMHILDDRETIPELL
jgi:uncharacterized protein (DUF1501 family)